MSMGNGNWGPVWWRTAIGLILVVSLGVLVTRMLHGRLQALPRARDMRPSLAGGHRRFYLYRNELRGPAIRYIGRGQCKTGILCAPSAIQQRYKSTTTP